MAGDWSSHYSSHASSGMQRKQWATDSRDAKSSPYPPTQPVHPHQRASDSQPPNNTTSRNNGRHENPAEYYTSDEEMGDDDLDEEEIEREPLPGERVLPRIHLTSKANSKASSSRRKGASQPTDAEDEDEEDGSVDLDMDLAEEVDELDEVAPVASTSKPQDDKKASTASKTKSKRKSAATAAEGKTEEPAARLTKKRRMGRPPLSRPPDIPGFPRDKIKEILLGPPVLHNTSQRRTSGNKRADRPRRPPPLEMSSGNRELPPPSAGMMSSMRNSGMVSPVVSGFPLHQADKVTRDAFRNSMVIKDAQRSLIQQRKQGLVPAVLDRPGEGPPPSAGVLPTLLTYIPTPSTTSGESGGVRHESDHGRDGRLKRSEKVKEKVRGMKIGTGDRSSVRDGLRTAPVGRFEGLSENEPQATSDFEQEQEIRDSAGYDIHGNSFYDMERRRVRRDGAEGDTLHAIESNANGGRKGYQPMSAQPGSSRSMQSQQRIVGPSNQGVPPSLHIPPYQRPDSRNQSPNSERIYYPARPESTSRPRHPYYPYPPPGRSIPIPPGGYTNQFDRDRDAFMSHFAKFYDAMLDSNQLRNDLATKIQKANELVAAHRAELNTVESLRVQYEAALADLKARGDRQLGGSAETSSPIVTGADRPHLHETSAVSSVPETKSDPPNADNKLTPVATVSNRVGDKDEPMANGKDETLPRSKAPDAPEPSSKTTE